MRKRTENDIWKNLYEPLLIETEHDVMEDETELFSKLQEVVGKVSFSSEESDALGDGKRHFLKCVQRGVKHVLSHRIVHACFYELTLPEDAMLPEGYLKVPEKDLQKYAVPNLVSRFFSLILKPNH